MWRRRKNFHNLLGNSGKVVLYGHSSGASAAKWAEVIGHYDKTEASISYARGKSHQSMFQFFEGSDITNTTSYNTKCEFIIKPEEISRMKPSEVFIIESMNNELVHTYLV